MALSAVSDVVSGAQKAWELFERWQDSSEVANDCRSLVRAAKLYHAAMQPLQGDTAQAPLLAAWTDAERTLVAEMLADDSKRLQLLITEAGELSTKPRIITFVLHQRVRLQELESQLYAHMDRLATLQLNALVIDRSREIAAVSDALRGDRAAQVFWMAGIGVSQRDAAVHLFLDAIVQHYATVHPALVGAAAGRFPLRQFLTLVLRRLAYDGVGDAHGESMSSPTELRVTLLDFATLLKCFGPFDDGWINRMLAVCATVDGALADAPITALQLSNKFQPRLTYDSAGMLLTAPEFADGSYRLRLSSSACFALTFKSGGIVEHRTIYRWADGRYSREAEPASGSNANTIGTFPTLLHLLAAQAELVAGMSVASELQAFEHWQTLWSAACAGTLEGNRYNQKDLQNKPQDTHTAAVSSEAKLNPPLPAAATVAAASPTDASSTPSVPPHNLDSKPEPTPKQSEPSPKPADPVPMSESSPPPPDKVVTTCACIVQ